MPKIIVITGAESTGKSTLTMALAKHFGVPFIPEIARTYVENLDRKYDFNDVEIIAKKQIEHFNDFKNLDIPFLFIDTWLINTKVWFEVVFNKVPSWLDSEIKKTKVDLFLVCDNDLPWIFDPVRENGGTAREILQKKYIHEIKNFGFTYNIVRGKNKIRFMSALKHLKTLK